LFAKMQPSAPEARAAFVRLAPGLFGLIPSGFKGLFYKPLEKQVVLSTSSSGALGLKP
jgi:hypothetical protein